MKWDSPPDLPLYPTKLITTGTQLLLIGADHQPNLAVQTSSRRRNWRDHTVDSMVKICLVQHTRPARGSLGVDLLILRLSRPMA